LIQKGKYTLEKKERVELASKKVWVMRHGDHLIFYNPEEWDNLLSGRLRALKGSDFRRVNRALYTSGFSQNINASGKVFINPRLRGEIC